MAIYMWREEPDELCFTANTAWSTVQLTKTWNPTVVTLETSRDGSTRTTYTAWNTITLSNIWDKVYFRNTSESTTAFSISSSSFYRFVMTWSIAASGDVNYLINKNSTDTLVWQYTYNWLFVWCSQLTSAPKLPATTLTEYCYILMFQNCSNLETIPEIPALVLPTQCCRVMFNGCTKIKLSTTQTWEYQTPYRIPTTWTWTDSWNALLDMFFSTWWTFTWTPTINTTYYTSNQVI